MDSCCPLPDRLVNMLLPDTLQNVHQRILVRAQKLQLGGGRPLGSASSVCPSPLLLLLLPPLRKLLQLRRQARGAGAVPEVRLLRMRRRICHAPVWVCEDADGGAVKDDERLHIFLPRVDDLWDSTTRCEGGK
jgi:hypothetical protein